jgi:3-deoxy-manno-octulosonate cytidylyltransferase (CMP-KDO synthetase)
MKVIAIIPSRYGSTRFPGKPLALIDGKSMIRRVYERSSAVFEHVCVATDDLRILDEVKSFGGNAVMTSEKHHSGTDRCYEALQAVEKEGDIKFDLIVNVQGDEPCIEPAQLLELMNCFNDRSTQIATLVKKFLPEEDIFTLNTPKVVVSKDMNALYFSRSAIPFKRGIETEKWNDGNTYYKHVGLYAFRREILEQITKLEQSPLEIAEQLEQLRWLENGYKIKVAVTQHQSFSIDTPQDLEMLLSNNIIKKGE